MTFAPKRAQTEPSSSPMTPPPITTRCSGTFGKAIAPVDVTICFSSTSTPGKGAAVRAGGDRDVLGLVVFFLPAVTTTTPVFSIDPALQVVDLVLLEEEKLDAFGEVADNLLLVGHQLLQIQFDLANFDAAVFKLVRRLGIKLELWSSAFEGMQPTFRQVPPSVPRFSTQAVFRPSCGAQIAMRTYPPGPPPITIRS